MATTVPAAEPSFVLAGDLRQRYAAVRETTRVVTANLSAEDQMVQSCAEASPVKWHQAHTSWFFEIFVLREFLPGYTPFHKDFGWLFNSYYVSLGEEIPEKKLRSSFSRPSLDQILAFRAHVDAAMLHLLEGDVSEEAVRRVVLGLNHEQQHQELALMDIKHAFFTNPLHPAYSEKAVPIEKSKESALVFTSFAGGLSEIGYALDAANPTDFSFDNETPKHKVYLQPFAIANRLTTHREYLEFMADNAYSRPELWLSDGWDTIEREGWYAPFYWQRTNEDESGWRIWTLGGWRGLSQMLDAPVCHVSFFEAEAYARWKGCRLPTEGEWETAAAALPIDGNLLETGKLQPAPAQGSGLQQMIGDCWQWTASPYVGYPGYKALPGALGEYNGKFMSSQMILRGGCCATPRSHMRTTYRNFFGPAMRWQFSGIRLAK